MSKRNRKRTARVQPQTDATAPESRVDAFKNTWLGLNVSGTDWRLKSEVKAGTELNTDQLDNLYRFDDLAARIVDILPQMLFRDMPEIDIAGDSDGEQIVTDEFIALNVKQIFRRAFTWARCYGAGMVVAVIDDGREAEAPVDLTRVRKIIKLRDFAYRSNNITVAKYFDEDPTSADYGEPEIYKISYTERDQHGGKLKDYYVHRDRCFTFSGVEMPDGLYTNHSTLPFAGDSVLQRVYDVIHDYQVTMSTLPNIAKALIRNIYKISGLAELIKKDAGAALTNRVQALMHFESMLRMAVIDKDNEEINRESTTIQNLNDLIEQTKMRLVTATGIPHTILLGESPTGSNATGNSTTQDWISQIESVWSDKIHPQYERILLYVFLAKEGPTAGKEPVSWAITLPNLLQIDEHKEADRRLKIAQADQTYIDRSVISPNEVRESRFGGDNFGEEIQLSAEETEIRNRLEKVGPGENQ